MRLTPEQIAANAARLRREDGAPVVERPVAPPKSEVAEALELLAKALGREQEATAINVAVNARVAQDDVLASAIVKALKQNHELLAAVREALAPREPEPFKPMEFDLIITQRDDYGRIKACKIKEC